MVVGRGLLLTLVLTLVLPLVPLTRRCGEGGSVVVSVGERVVTGFPATSIFGRPVGAVCIVPFSNKYNHCVSLVVYAAYLYMSLGCWFNPSRLHFIKIIIINYIF